MTAKHSDTDFDLLARIGDGDRELGFWGLVFLLTPIGCAIVWNFISEMGAEDILGLEPSVAMNYALLHLILFSVWGVSLVCLLVIDGCYSPGLNEMVEPFLRFILPILVSFACFPLAKFSVYQNFTVAPAWAPQPWWINHFGLLFSLFTIVIFCVSVYKYREIFFGILLLIYDSVIGLMRKPFCR